MSIDWLGILISAVPFLGSAIVFLSIAFLTWTQTPTRKRDALTVTLIVFTLPWGIYALWLFFWWLFDFDAPWLILSLRLWVSIAVVIGCVALLPRVWSVIQFRRRHGVYPRDFPVS